MAADTVREGVLLLLLLLSFFRVLFHCIHAKRIKARKAITSTITTHAYRLRGRESVVLLLLLPLREGGRPSSMVEKEASKSVAASPACSIMDEGLLRMAVLARLLDLGLVAVDDGAEVLVFAV